MSMNNNTNPRTLNAVTIGLVLIALALALVAYAVTGKASTVLCALLTMLGLVLAVMSVFSSNDSSGYGPSSRDTTLVGGLILIALGLAGMVHITTGNLLITVAVLIIIIAVTGIVMALKNRRD